jgi:uncharacterized protein (UPF0333 family)
MTTIYQIRKQVPGDENNEIEIVKEGESRSEIYAEVKELRKLDDGYYYWMCIKIINENSNVQRV